MQYLRSFSLPTEEQELEYVFSGAARKLDMACYNRGSAYPFQIFPFKAFSKIEFEPITIFYGGNGSGKSTLLNVIAETLKLERTARFNKTPLMKDYLRFCQWESHNGLKTMPEGSAIITSDGVFDFLLDCRAINEGIAGEREALFAEYYQKKGETVKLRSLDDYEALKEQNAIRRTSVSQYAAEKMPDVELFGKSNGESAFHYFTDKIGEYALYLLDEPENSLSASLQAELARYLEDAVRFYGCQLVIATHSPFLLSMHGAKIYDLDSVPVTEKPWYELSNMRAYYELFSKHGDKFEE